MTRRQERGNDTPMKIEVTDDRGMRDRTGISGRGREAKTDRQTTMEIDGEHRKLLTFEIGNVVIVVAFSIN